MTNFAILLGVGVSEDDVTSINAGRQPIPEFMAIVRRTGGDMISYARNVGSHFSLFDRAPRRLRLWLSVLYFILHKDRYSAVYATGEDVGFPLAAALGFLGWRGKIVCVVHAATTQKSWAMLNMTRLSLFERIICVSSAQCELIAGHTRIDKERIQFLYNWVDTAFFSPAEDSLPGDYVFACGMENRDYRTLVEALRTTRIPAKVVASGFHGAISSDLSNALHSPDTVDVFSGVSFAELADLYRRSRFVVLPLNAVDYAAGVTGLTEAMASGKAIITTDSPGIRDYVEDGVSGYLVPPHDPAALADAMLKLWNDPQAALAMGRRNREWITKNADVVDYAHRIAEMLGSDPVVAPFAEPSAAL